MRDKSPYLISGKIVSIVIDSIVFALFIIHIAQPKLDFMNLAMVLSVLHTIVFVLAYVLVGKMTGMSVLLGNLKLWLAGVLGLLLLWLGIMLSDGLNWEVVLMVINSLFVILYPYRNPFIQRK
ncbi:hypothetical protein [Streptococcus sp.]|nr:hypothetical protein [Streptococcus sp.]MDY3824739.1 hypothetical protein [Streptococcus sp.]